MTVRVIDLDGNDDLQNLVDRIKDLHTLLAQTEDELKVKKGLLIDRSLKTFHEDVALPTPDCRSSHEYHTDSGTVRVSFKLPSIDIGEFGKEKATDFAERVFGDKAEKLFRYKDKSEITASEKAMLKQAGSNSDLFKVSLKDDLTPDKLAVLVREHPDCFAISVKDKEAYMEKYPTHVEKKTAIVPKNGFIEKVSKMEKATLEKARVFLKKIFKEYVTAQVGCGNRSKE